MFRCGMMSAGASSGSRGSSGNGRRYESAGLSEVVVASNK